MRIGFFDSGVGGLSVLREALIELPDEDYFYYADLEHVPYGTKSINEVKKYVFQAVEFLSVLGIKALVVACNTATSLSINELRREFRFPVIGMEPAIKPAVLNKKDKNKRVLVLATPITLKEKKLKRLMDDLNAESVDLLPLPELVLFAEKMIFDFSFIKNYLFEQFSSLVLSQYESVVLGCTHFIFYADIIKKFFPEQVRIIDGNTGTVKQLIRILKQNNLLNPETNGGKITIFSSGKEIQDPNILDNFNKLLFPEKK
jgi:glutamate racemase